MNRISRGPALLFDLDGVIVHSNPLHREAWTAFNRQFGLETTDSMHELMYGRRNDQIIRDFYGSGLSEEEVQRRGAAKEALYRTMASGQVEQMLVPGLRRFLYRYRNHPMAVVTNGEAANAEFFIENGSLGGYFQVVVNGNEVKHPKPDPEIYLLAAERLGAEPSQCVVFEDSFAGVAAAKAAGMRVAGILTTHKELPGADVAVDNFLSEELERWLEAQQVGV
jgi:beta-phosphoglucomutase family hydrolase